MSSDSSKTGSEKAKPGIDGDAAAAHKKTDPTQYHDSPKRQGDKLAHAADAAAGKAQPKGS